MTSWWLHRASEVALLAAVVLVGCGGELTDAAGGQRPPDGDHRLVEGHGPDGQIPLVDNAPITLSIDGGQWTGTAACNLYRGTVEVAGPDLRVVDVLRAEMGCVDQAIMRSERAYLDALVTVDRHAIEDGRLVLRGPDTELLFDPVAPEPDAPLVGTTWELTSLVRGAGDEGAVSSVSGTPMLVFSDDGTFRGETGCNAFGGAFQREGNRITTSVVDASAAGCPNGLAAQETFVLDVLGDTSLTATLEGKSLRLIGDDGRGLDYRARS